MMRGHGFGLRTAHYAELIAHGVRAELVEAISENFIARGGRPAALLERVRQDAALVLHGVSLSIGGVDPLSLDYLCDVRALARATEAAWVSDHLCFGTFAGHYGHDLWPLPYTEEALDHVVVRVQQVQEYLGQRLVIENVSSYVAYRASEMPEWEFLRAVVERADAEILLDLNNVVVNAKNHGFNPRAYLDGLPAGRIRQLHLAGHSDHGTHAIDDHGSQVPEAVWQLYRYGLERFGAVPTIVEWDEAVPTLDVLEAEVAKARALEERWALESA
jgi:uncharacterized protein (UPF0276 family)